MDIYMWSTTRGSHVGMLTMLENYVNVHTGVI